MRLLQMAAAAVLSEATALVRECLQDGKLDAGEILRIGIFAAEKANALKGLSGQEKKKFVLETVKKAVEAAVPAERREQAGYTAALQVLPTVLDIAVAAAHGKLALKRVSAGCLVGCFSGLWAKREKPAAVLVEAVAAVREAVVVPAAAAAEPVPAAAQVPNTSQESVPAPAPAQKDTSPPIESPKEPSPQASEEASPLESRPPEPVAIELPNTATEVALEPVPEETQPSAE